MAGIIIRADDVFPLMGITAPTTQETAIVASAVNRAHALIRSANGLGRDPTLQTWTEYYPNEDHSQMHAGGVWEVNDAQAYYRRFASQGWGLLHVKHIPIRSVTTLWIDYDGRSGQRAGSFSTGTEYAAGSQWWVNFDSFDSDNEPVCEDGCLVNFGQWPTEVGSVKVLYEAGYTAAELAGTDSVIDASPIREACLIEAVRAARRGLLLMKRPVGSPIGLPGGVLTGERLGDYSYSVEAEKAAFGTGTISPEAVQLISGFRNWGYNLAS